MSRPSNKAAASAIERYARANIAERNDAYGQFMYHAELLRRGHTTIHQRDLATLPRKYREIIQQLRQGSAT
jgi:hypothetical protein